MKKGFTTFSSHERGFTLIELLVVVTIIAILSTIGISIYSGAVKRTNQVKIRSDLESIAKTYETGFVPETNTYIPLNPADFQGGQIPAPPGGGSYIVYGPNNQANPQSDGFAVCGDFNTGQVCYDPQISTCFCKTSTRGETSLAILLATPTPTPTSTATPLPSATPELLGNPSKARYPADNDADEYARNVWDLQVFNGRIYIGSGNSSNFAPRSNAGPVDLWYFDLTSQSFAKDTSNGQACGTGCIDDEQIDKIKIIDNTLYIPGHDPKNNGAPGMFRIEGGVWKKIPTSFDLHNYDVYKYQTKLFASGASNAALSLLVSSDNGASWQSTGDGTILNTRYYSLFEMGGSLYGYGGTQLAKYNGTNFTSICVDVFNTTCGMLPGTTSSGGGGRIEKSVIFNGQTVYVGGYTVNDHQWDPKGLFKATSEINATKLTLPNNALPQDLVIDGSTIYVVAYTGITGSMTNYVFSSTDLNTWAEVLRFTHETFARSFEYTNGYFYFGMGAETQTPIPNSTGDIIRYRYP